MTTSLKGFAVRNPLTVVGSVVLLIGTILSTVWVFTASGNELSDSQRNFAFITIVGLVANAVPSVLALLKSESTDHAIKNGVVKDKVLEALDEKDVLTRTGPVVTQSMQATGAALQALTKLLESNTAATAENTQLLHDVHDAVNNGNEASNG